MDDDQVGWDWFGLQLSDEIELMFYQIRHRNGRRSPTSHGVLITDGGATQVPLGTNVSLQPMSYWYSAETGARYPIRWRLTAPSIDLHLDSAARFGDQEWRDTFVYWEGSVTVKGTYRSANLSGHGFLEMTGYDR